jgi:hypothetical protein
MLSYYHVMKKNENTEPFTSIDVYEAFAEFMNLFCDLSHS